MRVKKIILYVGYVSVAVVFAISIMLLFCSRNKNETGKAKRTIGASYMTMNNPYFEVINEEIKAVVENKGDVLETRDSAMDAEVQAEQVRIHTECFAVLLFKDGALDIVLFADFFCFSGKSSWCHNVRWFIHQITSGCDSLRHHSCVLFFFLKGCRINSCQDSKMKFRGFWLVRNVLIEGIVCKEKSLHSGT